MTLGLLDSSEFDEKLWDIADGDKYEPDEDIIHRFRDDSSIDVPVAFTDMDIWSNYVDPDIYELDKAMRKFLSHIEYQKMKNNGYRTTASNVFKYLFGRAPTPKDSYPCRLINTLLKYYCTSYTGQTTYRGKKVPRVYNFSKYAAKNKRPFSLRLRMEEMQNGKGSWRRAPSKDKRNNGRRNGRNPGAS